MEVQIDMVRRSYQQKSDEELMLFISRDAGDLTPEALQLIKEEIARRGLDPSFEGMIDLHNTYFSDGDVEAWCNYISRCICPVCGGTESRLNANMNGWVWSAIFYSQYQKRMKIACGSCLGKANMVALSKSLLLGWWGFPWGIIYTLQSVYLNLVNMVRGRSAEHTNSLRLFVVGNKVEILTLKNDQQRFQEMLERFNKFGV